MCVRVVVCVGACVYTLKTKLKTDLFKRKIIICLSTNADLRKKERKRESWVLGCSCWETEQIWLFRYLKWIIPLFHWWRRFRRGRGTSCRRRKIKAIDASRRLLDVGDLVHFATREPNFGASLLIAGAARARSAGHD